MAERVQVVIEAQDNASGVIRGLLSQLGNLGKVLSDGWDVISKNKAMWALYSKGLTDASVSIEDIAKAEEEAQAAGVRFAEMLTVLAIDTMRDAFKVATEYASSVRDISLASGATAEQSSRLLQVLDDFEIQAEDVTTATRALTRNGLAPTIETIAQLSDQYLQLNSAEERNAFIQENLGRGGAKWANVLKEGGAAILQMNEGVDQALILNDEQIRQYEEMRLNVDNFNDNIMALKVTFVNALVPAINDGVHALNEFADAQTSIEQQGVSPYTAHRLAMMGISTESERAADAQDDLATAIDNSADSASDAATDYGKLLSLAQKLNDATRDQIQLAGYQELQDVFAKSDGGISPEEAAMLQEAGVSMGIFSQQSADAAASIQEFAKQVDAGNKGLNEYILLLNSIPTDVYTTIHQNTITSGSIHEDTGNGGPLSGGRASGGPVEAGNTYLVGEQGPELFTPKTSGEIIPNDKMGGSNHFYGATVYVTLEGSGFMEGR